MEKVGYWLIYVLKVIHAILPKKVATWDNAIKTHPI
jgi:hypothetical protein